MTVTSTFFMRQRLTISWLLVISSLLMGVSVTRGDTYDAFTKTRYYSTNKHYFVELTENRRAALYRAQPRRSPQLVWIRNLKVLPAKLIVTSDGRRVATIDRYYGNNANATMPAVILLNEKGNEIASYALSELADLSRVIRTISNAQWYSTVTLSADEKDLVIDTVVSKRDRAICGHVSSAEEIDECSKSVPYEQLRFSTSNGKLDRQKAAAER